MTSLKFCYFIDYEDGKIARMETTGSDEGIPVNIFADDGSDFDLSEGDLCDVDVCGIGSEIRVFETEEAFSAEEDLLAPIAMIPTGTFPSDPGEDEFSQSPHILFVGKVGEVERNPDAEEGAPNLLLTITTLGMELRVFLRYPGEIEPGNTVSGIAWLYADICRAD